MMNVLLKLLFLVFLEISPSYSASCRAGGFALRTFESTCPDGAKQCIGGASTRCCPTDYSCVIDDSAYCCLENEDCRSALQESPTCPSPGWALWGGNETFDSHNAWCCAEGFFGITILDLGVVCSTYGASLQSYEATAVRVSTTTCSSSSSSSSSFTTQASTVADSSSTITAPPIPTNTSEPAGGRDGPSLSGGAIAGIVIGAVAGVLAGIFVGRYFWVKKPSGGSHNSAEVTENVQHQPEMFTQPETYKVPHDASYIPQLEGNPVYQMPEGGPR